MITVTATKLRNNLFELLDKVAEGETIVIQRNHKEVARLLPLRKPDWRKNMSTKPKILVSTEELIHPIEDIWEEYI